MVPEEETTGIAIEYLTHMKDTIDALIMPGDL